MGDISDIFESFFGGGGGMGGGGGFGGARQRQQRNPNAPVAGIIFTFIFSLEAFFFFLPL